MKNRSHEHSFMDWAASVAPTLTVTFTALSFVASGVISYYFLQMHVFRPLGSMGMALAIAISVIMQGGRFVFLVLGQRDLRNGSIGSAVFGFLFSLVLTLFTHVECTHAAAAFAGTNLALLMWIEYSIKGITWIGQALEVRLLISTAGAKNADTEPDAPYIPSPTSTQSTQAETDRLIYQMAQESEKLRRDLAAATEQANNANAQLQKNFNIRPEQMNTADRPTQAKPFEWGLKPVGFNSPKE